MARSYTDLMKLKTFDERLEYLLLHGKPGSATFGSHRYMNQALYSSSEWQTFRRDIIVRDNGCDLACEEYPIAKGLYIHHINPITIDDIANRSGNLFDPDNVICVSFYTHQAIHFADMDLILSRRPANRTSNDTIPWR